MAAYVRPSGFSYAQAAKGATQPSSQTSSTTAKSGTAIPAKNPLAELPSGGNWADDVESSQSSATVVGETASETQNKEQEDSKASPAKDSALERAKLEEKPQGAVSGVSSPDLAPSTSTATKEDDVSSAQNGGSSESTWDTKSQTSEPAWIAEREKRQNGTQSSEKPSKGEKKGKESATPQPPKPVVLQPAAPPIFNVWQQRAENQKAKMAVQSKPAPVTPVNDSKENQRPQTEVRRKANSVAGTPRDSAIQVNEVVNRSSVSKPRTDESRSDSPRTDSTKATSTDRESEHTPRAPPPSVKDDVQWPTPDSVQERKAAAEKDNEVQRSEDATPTVKGKGTHWQKLAVTPIYTKPDLRESKPRGANGDRSSRPNGAKPRGPHRGASNPTSSAERERESSQSNSTPNNTEGTSSTRDNIAAAGEANAIPGPPRPTRSSSASPRGHQKRDSLPGRKFSRQTTGDPVQSEISGQDGVKFTSSKDSNFSKPFNEARRTKSPKKMSPSAQDDEEFVPDPIPRRNSAGTQTDEARSVAEPWAREAQSTRPGPDSRKESRNNEGPRDATYVPTRASKRGGRGRGGNTSREFTNGHAGSIAYSNGYGADSGMVSPYGANQSPNFQTPRGNHHFQYTPPRGNWRSGSRAHSIPDYYQQNPRGQFAAAPHPIHAIQTFVPSMYDPNGYPMSAVPWSPQMENEQLMGTVSMQVEYYFSFNNLIKDMYLRKHMDSQGFVFLDIIANFNRIKQLTQDKEIIKAVCMNSQVIEIRVGEDGKERLRKREGWEQFPLPMEQRDPSAQNAGPRQLEHPEQPRLLLNSIPPQFRGPASAGLPPMHRPFDRRSYDSGYAMANGYPPQFATYGGYPDGIYPELVNGDEPRGRPAKSPIHESVMSPVEQPLATALSNADSEPDSFPDDQINVLTVVVRALSDQHPPYHSAASRTFSNGSIDSRSISAEMQKPAESKSHPATNGEPLVNGSDKTLGLTRTLSPSKSPALERTASSADVNVFWVKDQEVPLQNLATDLTPEPYSQLRQRALDDRNRAVTGNCPYDLDILYQFWCHFLLRNFNNSMYADFKHFANEDARNRYCFTGLNNLVQFYSKSLLSHNPIRERVLRDYVELVKTEPPKMEGTAFKTLRSAWRNGALNLKNRKKLADIVDEKLKEQLDKVDT